MRRRTSIIAVALGAAVGWLPMSSVAARAVPATFADFFTSGGYGDDHGSRPWAGPWTEAVESDGPAAGGIQVDGRNPCVFDDCLDLIAEAAEGASITRWADLGEFTHATLTFTYQRHHHRGQNDGQVLLQATSGSGWSTLRSYPFAVEDASAQLEWIALDAFVSATTGIRFVIAGGDNGTHMMVDAVTITAWSEATPTTTTQPPPTTTPPTTTTTTTTTSPTIPTSTTTTSAPSVPTPSSTTTSAVTTTTTSAPSTTTSDPTPTTSTPTTSGAGEPGPSDSTTTTTDPTPAPPDADDAPGTGGAAPDPVDPRTTEDAIAALGSVARGLSPGYPTWALVVHDGGLDPDDGSDRATPAGFGGLIAGFSTAVESTAGSVIPSLLLALVVAWLSHRGLETAGRRTDRGPSPGGVRDDGASGPSLQAVLSPKDRFPES